MGDFIKHLVDLSSIFFIYWVILVIDWVFGVFYMTSIIYLSGGHRLLVSRCEIPLYILLRQELLSGRDFGGDHTHRL